MVATLLTIPGWMNSGPSHWQSRWEELHGAQRVVQADWECPMPQEWCEALEKSVAEIDGPIVLAAHSLGCHLVSRWALSSTQLHRVRHAYLVAPPDLRSPSLPAVLHPWRPASSHPLPFNSRLVYSSNDPYCGVERAVAMAAAWGSLCEAVGARGHLNGDSELGDWPEGFERLRSFL